MNGKVYLFGGNKNTGTTNYQASDSIRVYDLNSGNWQCLNFTLPYEMFDYSNASYLNGRFYMSPGFATGNSGGLGSHKKIVMADLVNSSASEMVSVPNYSEIWNISSLTYDSVIYFIGGHLYNHDDVEKIFKYTPSTGQIIQIGSMNAKRNAIRLIRGNDDLIYIIGENNRIERFDPSTNTCVYAPVNIPATVNTSWPLLYWHVKSLNRIYFAERGQSKSIYYYDYMNDIINYSGLTLSGTYIWHSAMDEYDETAIYAYQYQGSNTPYLLTKIKLEIDADSICAGDIGTYWVNNGSTDTIYSWGVSGGAMNSWTSANSDTFRVQWNNTSGLDSVWTCARLNIPGMTNCIGDTTWYPVYRLPLPLPYAGPDDSICGGANYLLSYASINTYDSVKWTTSGSGFFSDPKLLNPQYDPSSQDIANGTVTLYLEAFKDSCMGIDSLILSITPLPEIYLSSSTVIECILPGDSIQIPTISVINADSIMWNVAAGYFNDPHSTSPNYFPTQAVLNTGYVELIIFAYSACGIEKDTIEVQLQTPSTLTVSATTPICEGDDILLQADIQPLVQGVFNWVGPFGFTSSQQHPLIPNSTSTSHNGVYTVSFTQTDCPTQSGSVNVTVNSKPTTSLIFSN